MTRYVYNQSLISLKVITKNNPLNKLYTVLDNPVILNIKTDDEGTVKLNIDMNPLLEQPNENKCSFTPTSGKQCCKNCGNSKFCKKHLKISLKQEGKDTLDDEDSNRLHHCSYKNKQGKICGKKCKGESCEYHLKQSKLLKMKKLEPSYIDLREFVRKVKIDDSVNYSVDMTKTRQEILKDFNENGKAKYIYDENNEEEIMWFRTGKFPARMFRGAIDFLTQDIKSCVSNGNFKLNMKLKKDEDQIINSESWNGKLTPFPSELKGMKGYFTLSHKRIPLDKLFETIEKRSYQITEEDGKYYLRLPVSRKFFSVLKQDIKKITHSENQTKDNQFDVCVLDPGVRTFQTLYGLNHVVEIGVGSCYELLKLLILKSSHPWKKSIGRRIKNLVDELHWKTIAFLTANYKTIFIPPFKTASMLESRKLSSSTKREMKALRFNVFKRRLIEKCSETKTNLKFVSEAYTTCCCSECGFLTKIEGSKIFSCSNNNCLLFGVPIDRDFNAPRNILIRYLTTGQCSCPWH
jgi:hypothetical protein